MTNLRPRIAGPWRLLYRPATTGCYVNDHCLFKAADGLWHLFGITKRTPSIEPDQERHFTHGAGATLHAAEGLREIGIACDHGTRAWAPCVASHEGRYHMLYGPSPLRLATSDELTHWMENVPQLVGAPLDACHRDPMVLRVGGRWMMYATGISDRRGVVSAFESADLVTWRFLRFVLVSGPEAPLRPPWGATESPFVVERDGTWFLFVTYTDGRPSNYHDTLVFRSDDPTDFGVLEGLECGSHLVTRLHAHAPEVVRDDDGSWWITTCGWQGYGIPVEGGVAIAPLSWEQAPAKTPPIIPDSPSRPS